MSCSYLYSRSFAHWKFGCHQDRIKENSPCTPSVHEGSPFILVFCRYLGVYSNCPFFWGGGGNLLKLHMSSSPSTGPALNPPPSRKVSSSPLRVCPIRRRQLWPLPQQHSYPVSSQGCHGCHSTNLRERAARFGKFSKNLLLRLNFKYIWNGDCWLKGKNTIYLKGTKFESITSLYYQYDYISHMFTDIES